MLQIKYNPLVIRQSEIPTAEGQVSSLQVILSTIRSKPVTVRGGPSYCRPAICRVQREGLEIPSR